MPHFMTHFEKNQLAEGDPPRRSQVKYEAIRLSNVVKGRSSRRAGLFAGRRR